MKLRERLALHKYVRLAKQIVAKRDVYRAMSDKELKAQTIHFREALKSGKSLASIMVPAFAVVREADRRVLGMEPFYEQVLGALAMQFGNVAEMKTGEGKTLTATMPMYLNGLAGPGTFLITANAYLANRDAEDMGRVYRWLGVSVTSGVAKEGEDDSDRDVPAVYQHDIVYTTNSTLGFDYLLDNLSGPEKPKYLTRFRFALLDEIDAVLLDMAQTPLVISGAPRVQSNYFLLTSEVIPLLQENRDYMLSDDKKKVWFTNAGITLLEVYFGVDHLLSAKWRDLYRHLVLALKAQFLFIRDRDYVIADHEVKLLDITNGRELQGMRLEAGQHQAIEAKEHLPISDQTRSMASITYQNLFRMFAHLCGMTGTAKTDAEEFRESYHLDVVIIPTHKPNIRQDKPDKLYFDTEQKIYASVEMVKQAYAEKRPVLIETGSVTMSNLYSRVLLKAGIPHNLLNARSASKEAMIVKEAGQPGIITVATSMAGRGTDIHLGKGVVDKGGLLVIGTERMDNARIDNQLRGRAGRQGAPGETIFFASLEDRILLEHGPNWLKKFRKKYRGKTDQLPEPLKGRRFHKLINDAQSAAERSGRDSRFQTLEYSEVMRIQRETIYKTRDEIQASQNAELAIHKLIDRTIDQFLEDHEKPNYDDLMDFILNVVSAQLVTDKLKIPDIGHLKPRQGKKQLKTFLRQLMLQQLEAQHQLLPAKDQFDYFEKISLLKALDTAWIEQVDTLQQLRATATSRASGQHNPIYEYQKDARAAFKRMTADFAKRAVKNLMLSSISPNATGSVDIGFPE